MSINSRTWIPRGLRAPDAAAYIGIGKSKFFEMVGDGRLPQPKKIDGCVVWDRFALDEAFSTLGNHEGEDQSTDENPWNKLLCK